MDKPKKTYNKKKTPWQQYVGLAFSLLLGLVGGWVITRFSISYEGGNSLIAFVFFVLSVYLAFMIHIIVHEAGHLVFGLLTGYKFSSFRIFSFMWLMDDGKLKLKRLSIAGTGGQCLMSPPDIVDGKMPIVLYNLGGAIMNIIFSALFLLPYFLFADVAFVSNLFVVLVVVGIMTALMNGIPMRLGTVDNDGYNAFALAKKTEAMEAFWFQLKVNEQISKGIRLKDMPDEWFEVPSDEAMKNSMVSVRGVFTCNRLMDAEKLEEADTLISHLLGIESGIVGLHRNLLVCDRIFIEAVGECRRDVIETMLTSEQKKFMKSMKRFPSVLRTEYALALLFNKDASKVEKLMQEFDKVAKSYPYPSDIESEKELLIIAKNKSI